ncbi:MAG: K(+)-transporting ATPase subunit F, partial [Chloroflexi bacterium]|nr:K(+)-transporting ATPase subunit F [Chloroflexota bacterium]
LVYLFVALLNPEKFG